MKDDTIDPTEERKTARRRRKKLQQISDEEGAHRSAPILGMLKRLYADFVEIERLAKEAEEAKSKAAA